MRTRRELLLGALALSCTRAWAQPKAYPAQPINVVVPYAPGGNLDVVTRIVTGAMGRILNTSFVIDNRAGAGGLIGHEYAMRATPDGYTLVTTANGSYAVSPLLAGKKSFTAAEFTAVGMIGETPMVLEVPAASPYKSYEEFAAAARAKPGRISIGHSGNGTTNHVAVLRLQQALGTTFAIVPYKGSGPGLNDLLGNQVDAFMDQLTSSLPHLNSGRLKPLAVTSRERANELPKVPSLAELGLKDFNVVTASGLLVPAKTPAAVVATLNAALNKALAEPEVQKQLATLGSTAKPMTPQAFAAFLDAEDASAEALAKQGLLKSE